MSMSEAVPHLFRRRTLQRRLEILAQQEIDEQDLANLSIDFDLNPSSPINILSNASKKEPGSFREGSVLFDDCYEPLCGEPEDEENYISRLASRNIYTPHPPLPQKAAECKWLRILASCIVVSSNGVQFALSQFTTHLESTKQQDAFSSAISFLICFFTLGCICHGCFLMKYLESPRSSILITSPLVLSLMLAVVAVKLDLDWLFLVSFAITGFGIGPSYLSAIIHLQFWLPESPAMASSIGMGFGGLGSVAMSIAIEYIIQYFGVDIAFIALAVLLFLLQVTGGMFMRMPELTITHTEELMASYRSLHHSYAPTPRNFTVKSRKFNEVNPILGIELSTKELLRSWEFILFWIAAFTGIGPGYGMFANLSMILHRSMKMGMGQTSYWIVMINLIATVFGRLPTGYIADLWNKSNRKLFGSASRTMFMLLHGFQSIILVLIPLTIEDGKNGFSLFLIAFLTCIFGGCNVLIAALARELFAPINSSVVYGLILTATASSSLVFPNAIPLLYRLTGSDFVYSMFAAALAAIGTISCCLIRPLPKAFAIEE